jgi:hypothetical protein
MVSWQTMSESSNDRTELEGWKAIAGYLKVSIRTAQNFEKEYRLPVRRKFGIKAPVYALVSEVDEWVGNRDAISEPLPVSLPQPPSIGQLEVSPIFGTRRTIARGVAVVVALSWLAAGAAYVALRPKGPPVALAVRDQNLIVRNADGQELWHFKFPSLPEAEFYQPRFFERRMWTGELADSRKTGVLALFFPADFTQRTHRLYCFSESGQLLWEFVPGRTVADALGFIMAPPYYVSQMTVIKGRQPEDTRIAVASINYAGQAGQIAFLDALGRVRGEYWHPGHLSYMAQADIDGDGRNELLLGGANNAEHAATLVALDPLQVKGRSTPHGAMDPALLLMDMPESNERAVIVFARGCVGKRDPYTRVRELWVTPSRIVAPVVDNYTEGSTANIIYEFDHRLSLVGVTPMPEYALTHRALEQAHQLDHPYDQQRETDDLRRRMAIRWGNGHASRTEPRP